jgi:hypothetical protein
VVDLIVHSAGLFGYITHVPMIRDGAWTTHYRSALNAMQRGVGAGAGLKTITGMAHGDFGISQWSRYAFRYDGQPPDPEFCGCVLGPANSH